MRRDGELQQLWVAFCAPGNHLRPQELYKDTFVQLPVSWRKSLPAFYSVWSGAPPCPSLPSEDPTCGSFGEPELLFFVICDPHLELLGTPD